MSGSSVNFSFPGGAPIVYQDVMRVVIAGPLGQPYVSVSRAKGAEVPLIMSMAEAREVANALTWALMEYDQRIGQGSFYPDRSPHARALRQKQQQQRGDIP